MATLIEQGSLPRDRFGKVIAGAESDGKGRLVGQQVTVIRGNDLPVGFQGTVAWHGEVGPRSWRVGIEVEGGLAIVWARSSYVTTSPLSKAEKQATDCPF
jgi:hypothetical protein